MINLKLNFVVNGYGVSCEIASRWMSLELTYDESTLLRSKFGAIRQQAITWTNVDPDLRRHKASLHYNELTQ